MNKEIMEIKKEISVQNKAKQSKLHEMKKKKQIKNGKKNITLSGIELMTTRFQNYILPLG